MRHRKSGRKLGRNSTQRKALFRSLTISLIEHELIKTTVPKAKELRHFAERLVTLSKTDSVANRRLAFSRLGNKLAVKKLFEEFGPRYTKRPGGYMRVLKCGFRQGDSAPMAFVEMVDRGMDSEEATKALEAKLVKKAPKTAPAAKPAKKAVTEKPEAVEAKAKAAAVEAKPETTPKVKPEAELKKAAEPKADKKPTDDASKEK